MNKKFCSFTGHRNIADAQNIKERVKEELTCLIAEGYTDFYNGGAIGFDMLCALTVIELKKEYDIKLNMVLPCENQDLKWSQTQKKIYRYILDNSDSVEYVSKAYTDNCMLMRNKVLVDRCDILLAYSIKKFGGAFYTVNYAKRKGKKIINLAAEK